MKIRFSPVAGSEIVSVKQLTSLASLSVDCDVLPMINRPIIPTPMYPDVESDAFTADTRVVNGPPRRILNALAIYGTDHMDEIPFVNSHGIADTGLMKTSSDMQLSITAAHIEREYADAKHAFKIAILKKIEIFLLRIRAAIS